jgi:ABC-type phosphate transport system auxiliary subunit
MPVTARLSKRFYEAQGKDVANEMVDWFNAVDTTYKADLRDLIEVQAQRFRAELRQATAELRGDLRTEMHGELATVRTEMHTGFALLRTEMANLRAELIKWMFLFWLGTVGVTLAGVIAR